RCRRMVAPNPPVTPRPLVDDLLIRGGLVIDGTGAPGREADVSVSAGRIVAIAPRSARPARRVIDARGQVVAPGLIDIHTHSDFTLPLNPRAESKIRQGVTLEVVGNCGFSVAPALPGRAAARWLRRRAATRRPSRRPALTRPTTSATRCARRSPWPKQRGCTSRSRT